MPAKERAFRPDPVAFRDETGLRCLRVPLDRAGRRHAIVSETDYRRVRALGATSPWYMNEAGPGRAYVRTHLNADQGSQTLGMVARLITGAGPRTTIHYASGNRLDLRPSNLIMRKGKAKRTDAALAQRGAELRAGKALDDRIR